MVGREVANARRAAAPHVGELVLEVDGRPGAGDRG